MRSVAGATDYFREFRLFYFVTRKDRRCGCLYGKKLDLNKPVFELVQEYPELVDVLKDLGFSEITKPAMLNSVGRITTIPKGELR